MERINRFKNLGLAAAMVLLLVAIAGPWAYSADGLPPPEYCYEPNFLLASGHCAETTSGAWILGFYVTGFFYLCGGLVTGQVVFPERAGEFFGIFLVALLAVLVVLPFITTALRAMREDSRRWRVLNLAAWGLGGILCLLQVVLMADLRSGRFWGIWLYLALAVVMVGLEARAGNVKLEA